jgi:hypothetical protein
VVNSFISVGLLLGLRLLAAGNCPSFGCFWAAAPAAPRSAASGRLLLLPLVRLLLGGCFCCPSFGCFWAAASAAPRSAAEFFSDTQCRSADFFCDTQCRSADFFFDTQCRSAYLDSTTTRLTPLNVCWIPYPGRAVERMQWDSLRVVEVNAVL